MKKVLLFLNLLFLNLFVFTSLLQADTYYESSSNQVNGIYTKNSDIDLLSEELTLNIFKDDIKDDSVNFYLENKYILKNNTDGDITTKFYLPFENVSNIDNNTITNIKINNNDIEYKKRYAYLNLEDYSDIFDHLSDEYISNDMINKDSILYQYSLTLSDYSLDDYEFLEITINKDCISNVGKTFIYTDSLELYSTVELSENDFEIFKYDFINAKTTSITPTFKFKSLDSITYKDYALIKYNEVKEIIDISEMDYFNGSIWAMNLINNSRLMTPYYNDFVSLYEYDVTIKKDEVITNDIILPLVFDVEYYYTPVYYDFVINLSTSNFKSSNNITITINSDLYLSNLTDSYLEDNNSYKLSYNSIPNSKITFQINTSDSPVFNELHGSMFGMGILIIVLFIMFSIIPTVVVIIIYITQKQENNKVRILHLIEGIICSIVIGGSLLSLTLSTRLSVYLTLLLMLLLLVLFVIEKIKYHFTILVRSIIYFFFLLITIMFSITEISAFQTNTLVISLIYSIIFYILTIYYLIRYKNFKYEEPSTTYNAKHCYPAGIVNIYSFIGMIVLVVLLFAYITFSTVGNVEIDTSISIIIIILFGVFFLVCVLINQKKLTKYFKKYQKDLDYKYLEEHVLHELENKKLHPETKNLYYIYLYEYTITVDLAKANHYKSLIFMPNINTYKPIYDGIFINFLLDYQTAEIKVNEYKEKYKNRFYRMLADKFLTAMKAYYLGVCDDVLKNFPTNTKNEYENAISTYYLIHYYKHNDKLDEASKLEATFRKKYSCFKVLIDELDGIDIRNNSEITTINN